MNTNFWNTIEEIGWPTDVDAARVKMMQKGESFCVDFRTEYDQCLGELYKAAAASGHNYCCDSWDDTIAHVVGLGREEYMRNLTTPALMVERMNAGNYKESFSYCIPYEDDFDRYSLARLNERVERWAFECDGLLERLMPDEDERACAGGEVVADLVSLRDLLRSDWMEHTEQCKELAMRLSKFELWHLKWGVLNNIADYQFFLSLKQPPPLIETLDTLGLTCDLEDK